MANKPLKSIKFPELPDTYTIPQVDLVPTQDSSNAVSSGAVWQLNEQLIDELSRTYTEPYAPIFEVNTGGITSTGGNYNNHPERARTTYILIESGKTYLVHLNTTDYAFHQPWLYSTNAYASATRRIKLLDNQNLIFTAGENENYFRVGFKNSVDDTQEITEENRTTIHDSLAFYTQTTEQIDAIPIQNSTNAVSSGGVYSEIKELNVQLIDEISRSYTNPFEPTFNVITGGVGTTGVNYDNHPERARTQYISVESGKTYFVHLNTTDYAFHNAWLYTTNASAGASRSITLLDNQNLIFTVIGNESYFRVGFKNAQDATVEITEENRAAIHDALKFYNPKTEEIDAMPIQGSVHAVSSGGVYNEIETVYSEIDKTNARIIDEIGRTYTNPYEPTFSVNTGGITPVGANYDNHPERARTSYVFIEPGKTYFVHLNTTDYAFYRPWLYSRNAYASATRMIELLDNQNLVFTATESENYFRVGFKNSVDDTQEITEENRTTIHDALNFYTSGTDAIRTGEFIRFTVKVNNTWSHTTATDTGDHESGEEHDHLCILTLPESYTPNGAKTPLIMYCHGASCGITDSSWYGNGTGEGTAGNFLSMVRAFTAQGYAIFDVNNTRQVSSGFNDWGCLPLMSAYIKAWEYIKEKYNVSDKLYLLSASMGTPVALNMMKWYKGNILASLILAPRPFSAKGRWDDTYGEITDERKKEFLVAWGFEPDTILNDETYVVPSKESVFTVEVDAKLCGFYHYENMVTIGGTDYIFEKFPPTKVMVGTNDTGFLAEVREYFSALQNFGNYINYREVAGQSHGAMCTLVNGDLRSEGLAWFERFRYAEPTEEEAV